MIKRVLVVLFLLFLINSHSNASAQANVAIPTYQIVIDNKELKLSAPPYVQNGTTMVPFRPVFNQLGLDVKWGPELNQVVGKNSDLTIKLTIGSVYAKVNDVTKVMPVAPVIHNGTTYIPLRFVGMASEGDVEFYGGAFNVVWITSAKQNELFDAVLNKNVVEVKRLLESGADPTIMFGPVGPAIYDYIDDSIEIVKLFLEDGMDVNYFLDDQYNSRTLLQIAAGDGQVEVLRFLLNANADPTLTGGINLTPLEFAEYWKDQLEKGYQNIIDPSETPTVESYEEIIELLKEAVNK